MQTAEPRAATLHAIDLLLRAALAIAAVALLSLPAARGHDVLLGWVPGWLVGLPLASWIALRIVSARGGDDRMRRPAQASRRSIAPASPRARRSTARRLRHAA